MPLNALGQYSASHKTWDHVGNILPDIEHSEGERPAIEFKPAAWLPVQFLDKYYEDWNVVMSGKILALDNDGRVCPAQYGLGGATITYTQNDVDAQVTDVTTGLPCNASSISASPIDVSAVSAFLGRTSVAMAVSRPIGVAPYAYLRWAGGDGSNPANLIQHNYIRQHQVAVLCDYVVNAPLVPAVQTVTSLSFGAPSSNLSTSSAVGNKPVAANTVRTPIAFSGGASATLFINQVDTLALVTSAGDWFINLTTGVVTVYAASQPLTISISYYHYAAAPSTVSKFSCAVGNLKPGDFVKCDANSNYVVAAVDDPFQDVVGQVLERDASFPRDAMDRVRTAFAPAIGTNAAGALPGYLGQLDQMPGSATGGMPADISYTGAANTIVRINLVSR